MAFDPTPSKSTYQTKDIKLINQWESRDTTGTKDGDTVNCFYEVIRNKAADEKVYYVTSRDGTVEYPYVPPSTNIRGVYYWEDEDKLFIAYDTSIAVVTGSTGVLITTLTPGFAAGTTEVGFTEFNYDIGTVNIVATNGTVLITIDSANVVTASVSPDLPTPHVPNPIFLDGYLFLVKTDTADIYNSNLNDPLLYTSGDFISAEMLPDNLIRLERLNNYLVAFGTNSIEYFYDAANETGSPLLRNDTPVKLIGYLGGLARMGNKLFFIGNTATSSPELFELEDFKINSLGTAPIRRYIEPYSTSVGTIISFQGHDFYVITVGPLTYMVDMMTKLWTRLRYKTQTNFPISRSLTLPFTGVGNTSLIVQSGIAELSYFDPDVYYDDGVDFNPTIVTDNEMFSTMRNKFVGRLTIVADRTIGTVAVSTSDDDFQTWSAGRNVSLNQQLPTLNRMGKFRRRAHKLVHTGNARLRIQSLELEINMGGR